MLPDPNAIGQDRTYQDATDAHDADHGTYVDAVDQVPTENRLPTAQMPQATDPSPFSLGPMSPAIPPAVPGGGGV